MKLHSIIKLTAATALLLGTLTSTARLNGAYYGTNYTVPFAHAYRSLGKLGVDRRWAIDRDMYHMARLGLNAFRLHLWDVELSDAEGNMLDNEHLALLDYLLTTAEKRGISVILTAQTNFGNGYPERNSDPNGAFSYDFEKCHIHDLPEAQAIQERYLKALVSHVNSLTGKTYAETPGILAIEINNEPCHSGTHEEITAYVDRMASALRDAGWKKDILYNVSHNLWRTSAFFKADIDGTTYQWYPTGLVHGSRRRGNFLPVLDSYDIPFDTVPGFAEQPKVIYEYDPADVLDTYLFPAAARTFRKAGFDWVTQFAYDPIDMARFNSEYQTHFLNLAYTPGKAVGMAIAAEVMRRTPIGTDYGKYPADTVFGDFTVSARRNLAMFNDGEHYYHTNKTADSPKAPKKLRRIMGVGSSPLVSTDGTGAYFIDRLDKDTWRLEVMPDVTLTDDPFARPSLSREVAQISDSHVCMSLSLPGLQPGFAWQGTGISGIADGTTVSLRPGVYLLGNKADKFGAWPSDKVYDSARGLRVGEYVMPPLSTPKTVTVAHTPQVRVAKGQPLTVEASVFAPSEIDSVLVFPADVDFWNPSNKLYRMEPSGKNKYTATVDPQGKKDGIQRFSYNIVVYCGNSAVTFPSGEAGTPLDWDFGAGRQSAPTQTYNITISNPDDVIMLFDSRKGTDGLEYSSIPETWGSAGMQMHDGGTEGNDAVRIFRTADAPALENMSASKYVGDIMACHADSRPERLKLRFGTVEGTDSMMAGFVTADGFTYSAPVKIASDGIATLDFGSLTLAPTLLNPAPYPSFLSRRFTPDPATAVPFSPSDIEQLILYIDEPTQPITIDLIGAWLY